MASRSTSVARLRNEGSFRLSSGASSRTGSQSNLMKMNEENPRTETYAKFDEYQSSFYSHLPTELNKLRSSDFYHEEHQAHIDTETAHTLLLTPSNSFVWKYSSITPSSCYIFPSLNTSSFESTFGQLVPFPNREPGLILLGTTGKVQFWDTVLQGLSGATGSITAQVPLASNETTTGLFRCTASCYIITTSSSIPYRLTPMHNAGKWNIRITPFRRPSSALALVTSMFSGGGARQGEGMVGALAFGPGNGPATNVWVLLSKTLQQWTISEEGWEKLIHEERDILQIIAHGLTQFSSASFNDFEDLDISMSDIVLLSPGELALMASYSQQSTDPSSIERLHAIVKLAVHGERPSVTQIQIISFTPNEDMGATNPTKLLVLRKSLAVVQSGDRILLISLNGKYNSVLPLKSPLDRFLAVAQASTNSPTTEQLIAMTASGMLEITVDVARAVQGNLREQEVSFLEKIMTQAILYGSLPYNPLQFKLPPHIEGGNLSKSTEQISMAILQGLDSALAPPPSLDMQTNLRNRVDRLRSLIGFISSNGVLNKLTPVCRAHLQNDAERVTCANQLFTWFNGQAVSTGGKVLVHAINAFMTTIPEPYELDLVRMFFRTQLNHLSTLLPNVPAMAKSQSPSTVDDRVSAAIEANSILGTVIRESWQYRKDLEGVYDTEPQEGTPVVWTADLDVLKALNDLFDFSLSVLMESTLLHGKLARADSNPFNKADSMQILLNQLGHLVHYLFSCTSQRLSWLALNGHDFDRETFRDEMMKARKEQLNALVDFGMTNVAFDLAEDYGDFQNLALLCIHPGISSSSRIEGYLDRYREDFASELYHLYIKNQSLQCIFEQNPKYFKLIDAYFEKHPMPRVSWIQDITFHRYQQASLALIEEADSEKMLEVKNVMLSITLLSHYAETGKDGPTEDQLRSMGDSNSKATVDYITTQMNFISVQQSLRQVFERVFAEDATTRHYNLENKSELVLRTLFQNLESRPAIQKMIKRSIRAVLQERSLENPDLIELISSQDEAQPEADHTVAIRLLARSSEDMDDATRVMLLRAVWRKVFLTVDWAELQNTAGLSDAQINHRLRETRLYATLRDTVEREDGEGRITPRQAAVIPTLEELDRRWPGFNADLVEDLLEDYRWEQERLDHPEVGTLYEQIDTLIRHDMMEAENEDAMVM